MALICVVYQRQLDQPHMFSGCSLSYREESNITPRFRKSYLAEVQKECTQPGWPLCQADVV